MFLGVFTKYRRSGNFIVELLRLLGNHSGDSILAFSFVLEIFQKVYA